jgi:hypothetical protein
LVSSYVGENKVRRSLSNISVQYKDKINFLWEIFRETIMLTIFLVFRNFNLPFLCKKKNKNLESMFLNGQLEVELIRKIT